MTGAKLPQVWDLSSFFPSFGGPEYRAFQTALRADLQAAAARAGAAVPLSEGGGPGATRVWAEIFAAWEDATARAAHLNAYLECMGSAHADDEAIQAEEAAMAVTQAEVNKLKVRLMRGLRGSDEAVFDALAREPAVQGAQHTLRRLRAEAAFQMTADLEDLNADLAVDGFQAWGRLYDVITGKMTFEMAHPDGRRSAVPMAQRRALMEHPDRAVRRAAFEGGNRAWAAAADTCAAAINSLAGTRHTLDARRSRAHFLDGSLFQAALSQASLDAMFEAIRDHYDVGRDVLRLGAKLQGTPRLAWYDLEAPRPLAPAAEASWDEGVGLVQAAFDRVYPRLGAFFRAVIERRWIDSEQRANKRGGGFLTGSPVIREQRIFMTYCGTLQDVLVLAHESGHAWHNHLLTDLRPCARVYPMTLAETASTFAEHVLLHGLLSAPGLAPERRAVLLDLQTGRTASYLLNLPARFLFERRFYEERKAGVVSATRLGELMVAAQRETYGDTLEVGGEDPLYWASKLHFYITDRSFYNFPYTFGYLLSRALFTAFLSAGADFLPRYEAFLRETGRATCEDAVRTTLGWDLSDRAFWTGAIRACAAEVREFEKLRPG